MVWMLMLDEVHDGQIVASVDRVPLDEPGFLQLREQQVDVGIVIGQHLGLDAFRPVFQPPLAVGQTPEPGE